MLKCPLCETAINSATNKKNISGYEICHLCGVGFSKNINPDEIHPAADTENLPEVYLDSKTKIFSKSINKLNSLIVGETPKTLLDIGCGYGYFLKMAKENGWDVEGIEISQNAVKHCREILNLKVYDKPLAELNLPSDKYDAVTMFGVLDVLPQPLNELKEVCRILKKNGILLIRVNNFSFHLSAYKLGLIPPLKLFGLKPGILHRYGINNKSLRYILMNSGFSDIKIINSRPTEGDPYGTGGKMGKFFVAIFKKIYYFFSQLIYYLTFGHLTISSSIIAIARKK